MSQHITERKTRTITNEGMATERQNKQYEYEYQSKNTEQREIDEKNDKQEVEVPQNQKLFIVSSILGLIFGFAIGKGQVFQPQLIVGQMIMKRFVMLKMFLSAVSFGFLILGILSCIDKKSVKYQFDCARKKRLTTKRGILATIVGAFFFGCGMAVCGACPGTVWVQIGTGLIPGATYVFLGMIIGSLAWTFLGKYIENSSFYTYYPLPPEKVGLEQVLGFPFGLVCGFLSVLFAIVVFLLEMLFPYQIELNMLFSKFPSQGFSSIAWPPYISGMIVGSLQLPAILLLGTTIGSSGGVPVLTSLLLYPLKDKNDFIKTKVTGKMTFFQPVYLASAVIGGLLAGTSSSSLSFSTGFSPALSLIGGFLLAFFSLFSGGCTSGHGISGMQMLSVTSIIATCSMFAGGISCGLLLYYTGAYGSALVSWF